jgi:LemA protein
MKKNTIILISILGAIVILFFWSTSSYNGLVNAQENVNSQWANVQTQYQRRADLIPNLVNTVKGYAVHEKSTLEGVVNARAKATQITIDPSKMTAQKLQEYQAAQGQVSSALGRLMVISENYPQLKADQNFMELQAQLEGTENRIAVERSNFNAVTEIYNKAIRSFPSSVFAAMFGFEKKPYFEAEKSSQAAPKVQF